MRSRRAVLCLLLAAGVPAIARVHAQASPRVRRVGILILASLPSVAKVIEGFRAGLRELGHVDGRNLAIEVLSAEGDPERLPQLASRLVARKVDVIVTGGGNVSTLAAREATSAIPIVMMSSIGAVEAGLVQSLARPGGNVTGLTVPRDLGFKQIELLRELVPSLARVAVLTRQDATMAELRAKSRELAQQLMSISLDYFEVRSSIDLAAVLGAAQASKPEAMIVAPDPLFYQQREQIVRFTRSARIPDMHAAPDFVEEGGLAAYGPAVSDIFRGVTRFVDRLLKGAKAADLPVEQPTRFELVLNLKTASLLELKIAPALRLRADRVIE